MGGLFGAIIGSQDFFTFEERVFNLMLVLGILLTTVAYAMDLFFYSAKMVILTDLLFLLVWIFSYWQVRRRRAYQWVIPFVLGVMTLGFYPFIWLSSGGINSIMPVYGVLFAAVICIVVRGKSRYIFLGLLMLTVVVLSIHDLLPMNATINFLAIRPLNLMVMLFGISFLLISYANIYHQEKSKNMAYAHAIEEQNRQQHYYMESLEDMNDQLRSERHDFNNHLGVIYGLLVCNNIEESMAYASTLVTDAMTYNHRVDLSYTTVRAMLNYKLSVAQQRHIETDVRIHIPEGLILREYDLTLVLGNLIDNAIEAVVELPVEERSLVLRIEYKPDYLVINIKNPYKRQVLKSEEQYLSTKRDQADHGYGLSNVKAVVDKHQGMMVINDEKGFFEVHLALLVRST